MKRLFALLIVLLLGGCSGGARPAATTAETPTETKAPVVQPPAPPASATPTSATPPAPVAPRSTYPTRDEMRETLLQWLREPGDDPLARVKAYAVNEHGSGRGVPYVEADLNGDGQVELVTALRVAGEDPFYPGGALFVIYQKDGQWAVDRSDPLPKPAEYELMAANLFGTADLTGAGHPQIIWFRAASIATGPQPFSVFVSDWRPGSFTLVPGAMAISFSKGKGDAPYLAIDGKDLLLSGSNRGAWPAFPDHTDRYRFVDGAFRRVDRRLLDNGDTGYARLWDGLVAEDVGRTADAAQAYRDAADPQRPAHAGSYMRYNMPAKELTADEMAQFAAALRPFARFRLGGQLLQTGQKAAAQEVLKADGGPYAGLTEAMRTAANRQAGCTAATEWAKANPDFLQALDLGVGIAPWTPELLCSHVVVEDPYMGLTTRH